MPAQVTQHGSNGTFAYVIKTDQSVEQRPIKVGYSREGVTLVEEGLTPDERVVLDGQYKLRAGMRVQVVPSDRPQRQAGSASRAGATP